MKPTITVITPTYNRAEFLPKTIESVLNQTFYHFEYFIIDDGSSDNTKDVVKPYLVDKRIKYIFQENAGEPAAANLGWNMANGNYFVQINSDDPALPNLFEEMTKAMDENPDKILAYCDFQFIDENDNILQTINGPEWDFYKLLKLFSCDAATPGVFFRRSGLTNWKQIRQNNYKHINDIEMFWDMALEGGFLHVPKLLAQWREHSGQISYTRYKAIDEIERWYNYYFSKENLPDSVKACQDECRKSILNNYINLIKNSKLGYIEKQIMLFEVEQKRFKGVNEFSNLQIGDNDLVGNKFNGHDLHLMLHEHGVQAYHIVRNKESNDSHTIKIDSNVTMDYSKQIMSRKEFLLCDIIHLHLIHNTDFDINMLPVLTTLKPTVITLHDPFFLGGHCIHHSDCENWKKQCFNCPYPDTHFPLKSGDSCALNFAIKEKAIQNSDINVIVASQWMENKVKQSPIFKGKKVYRIPFGINQKLFCPVNLNEAKSKLGISQNSFVLMFRADYGQFKGIDTIKKTLLCLAEKSLDITLITVGSESLLEDFKDSFRIIEFGWLKNDETLAQLYQACDLFLMPSSQEAFGMMAIEAMSCGKVVLSTTGTSLPSVINSPYCGIAVDEKEYAETLLSLIQDEEKRHKYGKACLEFAQENYNSDIYVKRMIDTYKKIMSDFNNSDKSKLILSELLFANSDAELQVKDTQLQAKDAELQAKDAELQAKDAELQAQDTQLQDTRNLLAIAISENTKILNSRSWKITKPLRIIRSILLRKKKTKPKVTIITPTYNRAKFLPNTIESVLTQTLVDFEYFIIDDGSSDNTKEVIAPYLADERIKYIFQENAGEPAAANLGWSMANGDYFVQINSDDPALPNLFEEMTKALDENPDKIVAYCDFNFIDEDNIVFKTTHSPNWNFNQLLKEFSCVAAAPGTFFRRSALKNWKQMRQNNYKYINDIEMFWDMALEGDFLHVPKVLAQWREHAGQISYTRYKAIDEIEKWYYHYFSKENLPDSVKACRAECRKTIFQYYHTLILTSDVSHIEKKKLLFKMEQRRFKEFNDFYCLQVGDNDLIGINQKLFCSVNLNEAKSKLGISQNSFVLMFRADYSQFKEIDTIKETLLYLVEESLDITLITVGNEGLLEDFKDSFKILEFGWLKNDETLVQLYQACDLFLMPSNQEAFGMMAIEAMSCGKVVLSTTGTSLPSVINSPYCGIAVDEKEYAETLLSLIQDESKRHKHGKACLEFAQKNYNSDIYVKRMIDTYKKIMSDFDNSDKSKLILSELLFVNSDAELQVKDTQLQTKDAELQAKDAELQAKDAELHDTRNLLAVAFSENTNLLNSRSWKITKPLRTVRRVLTGQNRKK